MIASFYLALGFFLLWKGGDLLVDGARAIGIRTGIPKSVLGLTLIAFGTSAPELVVSIVASFNNKGEIILANIIGSNMANTFFILGIMGLLSPIVLNKLDIKKELYINVLASFFLLFIFINPLHLTPTMSWRYGSLFLCGFLIFISSLFPHIFSKEDTPKILEYDLETPVSKTVWKDIFKLLSGAIGLAFGGNYVVSGAILSAQIFGISESLIGLFAVALGTSLPELVTSVIAAKKNEPEMAVGNIIGSNIFNIFLILGASACMRPITLIPSLRIDASLIALSSLFLVVIFFFWKKAFYRRSSILFLLIYAAYTFFIFIRG